MADYDNLSVGQIVETAPHINGWQKLRRLKRGGTILHSLSDGGEIGCVVGAYTGDGAASKSVTGLGFTPRVVQVFANADPHGAFELSGLKTSSNGTRTWVSGNQYEDDHIISLDSGGFTLGDGTGSTNGNTLNINLAGYTYIAWS